MHVGDTLALFKHFIQAINSNVCSHFFHFCPDDDWSIQLKRQQVIFRAQVGITDNLSL